MENKGIDIPCERYLDTTESRYVCRDLCSRLSLPGATAKYLAGTEERRFSRNCQELPSASGITVITTSSL